MTAVQAPALVRPVRGFAASSALRSLRSIARSPGMLINPIAMSLFFMIVYSGQLSVVGPGYLGGASFAVFVVPLILLTGAFLSSAVGGELLVRDLTSGYHDRLVLAHGSPLPLLGGPVVAAMVVIAIQAGLTLVGSSLIGFRAGATGVVALLALTVAIGLCLTPFALAAALRFGTSAAVNAIPTGFFGLSFFTGFLVPPDQLGGWMRTIASVNPLTPVLDTMRATIDPTAAAAPAVTAVTLIAIAVIGVACCAVATRMRRRHR